MPGRARSVRAARKSGAARPGQSRDLGRRPRKTRGEIYRAAVSLFMKYGVDAVTMQEIADHAETARSTVFNHYPNKMALLEEFFLRFATTIIEQTQAGGATGFLDSIDAFFAAMGREAASNAPILHDIAGLALGRGPLAGTEATIDARMLEFLTRIIENGIAAGEIRSDANVPEVAELILGLVTVTNHDWVNKGQSTDLADDHRRRFGMLYGGLAPPVRKSRSKP